MSENEIGREETEEGDGEGEMEVEGDDLRCGGDGEDL